MNKDAEFNLYEIGAQIAAELSTDETRSPVSVSDYYVTLQADHDVRIGLMYHRRKDRLVICGQYPKYAYVSPSVRPKNITFSAKRKPREIAAGVKKRFLPGYLSTLVTVRKNLAEFAAYEGRPKSPSRSYRSGPWAQRACRPTGQRRNCLDTYLVHSRR